MKHKEWEKRRRAVMLHFAKGWRRAFRKDMRELARAAVVVEDVPALPAPEVQAGTADSEG